MNLTNSFELLVALKKSGYRADIKDKLWWPNSGTFEVVVGAILTQQTKWENVEICLQNLKNANMLNIHSLAKIDILTLQALIKPAGFYRKKAKNIKLLSQNILNDFQSFEHFSLHVKREWLLAQKGLGKESCDSILCYACKQEVMVVDSYTHRLLNHFGYEFETYELLQEWVYEGLYENEEKIKTLYNKNMPMSEVFARFHGKIVMFCKENMRGKQVKKELSGLTPD